MKLRIGIIGIGHMGQAHMEGFQRIEEAQVIAVVDTANVPDAGPQFAAKYGVACEPTLDALLARQDIDAVAITTPHSLHMEHALKAFAAGKHVLLEKPMEVSLDKCDRIIEAADRARRKLMIAHSHRYWPGDALAKKLIVEGAIGKIVMIRDALLSGGYRAVPPPGQPRRWTLDPTLYGPGGLLAWGCHCMDRFRFWLDSDCTEVYAHGYPFRTEIPGETSTHMIMMRFASGASATLWYSETLPRPAWSMDHAYCRAEIVGEKGLIDVNPYAFVRISREGAQAWEELYVSRPEDNRPTGVAFQTCWCDEDLDFVRCVMNDTEPPVTGLDGRKAVEMCLAAYKSGEMDQVIKLPM